MRSSSNPRTVRSFPSLTDMQPSEQTIGPIAMRYIGERKLRREIGRDQVLRERAVLLRLSEIYGRRSLQQMGPWLIDAWFRERTHLMASTLAGEWRSVRRFVRWLHQEGLIAKDPMVGMKAPRVPRREPRALEPAQVAKVLAACPNSRAKAAVTIMVEMCLRKAEVCAVRHEDWDRTRRQMYIVGKGDHGRWVPVTEAVERALAVYLGEHPSRSGPILKRFDEPSIGLSKGTLANQLRVVFQESGVKVKAHDGVGCHSFRHTGASDILEAGADIRDLQELLGHVSITSTQVYLRRARMERVRAAMEGRRYDAA